MLDTGITGKITKTVTEELTAKTMGSGVLDVFATPAMIALIEETAWKSVSDKIDDGMTTVGTKLDIAHTAATPLGMTVTCETKLIEIDRRRLVFEAVVSDECGEVGRGVHERFIVDADKFMSKTNAKRKDGGSDEKA